MIKKCKIVLHKQNGLTRRRASRLGDGAQRRLYDGRPLHRVLAPPDEALLPPERVLSLLVLFYALLGHTRWHAGCAAGDGAFRARGGRQNVELARLWIHALDAQKITACFEIFALAVDLSFSSKGNVGAELVTTEGIAGCGRCNGGPGLGRARPCAWCFGRRRTRRSKVRCATMSNKARRKADRT